VEGSVTRGQSGNRISGVVLVEIDHLMKGQVPEGDVSLIGLHNDPVFVVSQCHGGDVSELWLSVKNTGFGSSVHVPGVNASHLCCVGENGGGVGVEMAEGYNLVLSRGYGLDKRVTSDADITGAGFGRFNASYVKAAVLRQRKEMDLGTSKDKVDTIIIQLNSDM